MRGAVVPAVLLRAAAFALMWWALTEGGGRWQYGLVAVAAATATSLRLLPPRSRAGVSWRRPAAMLSLVLWFLRRSVAGGVDVARRAFTRPLDLSPGVVEYRFRLPAGPARIAALDMVSLMPGTLSAELDGDVLQVHVLDTGMPVREQLTELEDRMRAARPPG